jgi:hypothetical protein
MKELIEKGYVSLEEDKLIQLVSICLRISRINNDYLNEVIFLRELSTDKKAFNETYYQDTSHLKVDAQKLIHKFAMERWIEERKMSYTEVKDDEPSIYIKSVGELLFDIKNTEDSLNDFITPSGMTPIDTAYFEDENQKIKGRTRLHLSNLNLLKEKIRSRCLNYLISVEKQIKNQNKANSIQYDFINEVNNYFKRLDNSIYEKLVKSLELLNNNDNESLSLLLTEIRRTIKSVADYFYPPSDIEIMCSDGINRILGNDQYLNRLHEFINTNLVKSTSNELLIIEFESLEKIIRKLNELASKGVHSNVTKREAKQCFLSFYNFLSNIVTAIQAKQT